MLLVVIFYYACFVFCVNTNLKTEITRRNALHRTTGNFPKIPLITDHIYI